MDELVQRAMSKWPHVPACYGWLALDARGNWYMRDERIQAAGPFTTSKGSRIEHEKLIDFIGRNYQVDERGCWYFQNGPQQVYVELEVTPWIWRIQADGALHTHTGQVAHRRCCYSDEQGRLFIDTDLGIGLVHTQDVVMAAGFMVRDDWLLEELHASELSQRFHFIGSPLAYAPSQA